MDQSSGTDEPRDAARRSRDGGFNFIEIAITVALMSIVIIPILLATTSLIRASSTARFSSEGQRVITDAADRVTRADPGCSYKNAVEAAALSRGWPAERATVRYQYFAPGPDVHTMGSWLPSAPGTAETDACPGGNHSLRLIQLVTITVVDEAGSSRTIQVVKSDV